MDVFVFMSRQVELKREAGKESTADLYRATCNRLQRFLQRPTLRFEEITSTMVDQFGEWMMQEGRPVNTVNTYLSNFRTLYNKAVRAGLCPPGVQPFSHLQLKRDVTVKRAVPVQVLERAVKLKPKEELKETGTRKAMLLIRNKANVTARDTLYINQTSPNPTPDPINP